MTETSPRPEPGPEPTVEGKVHDGRPAVLFLCVHNAGRSQMALGFFRHLAGDAATAWSGGSEPGAQVNPSAVEAMREVGIDISGELPKAWTDEVVRAADVVVTMGCGDACPVFPGKRYEDWVLEDPAGQDVAAVRPIRDEVERRVRRLLAELDARSVASSSSRSSDSHDRSGRNPVTVTTSSTDGSFLPGKVSTID
jgi:protein-tyrosine-phosphatase